MKTDDINQYQFKPSFALLGSTSAIIGVTILIIIKGYAYFESDSTALLGTLVDSVVDMAVSIMLLYAVSLSLKPVDEKHRYGFGKAEGIASLLQGGFMGGAGVFLGLEAVNRFSNPVVVTNIQTAIIVSILAVIISAIIITIQRRALRNAPSLAVEADYQHYKTDILLNLTVIVALILSFYGAPYWVDPLFGLFIAGYFIMTAINILNKSTGMLMDREVSEEVRQQIRDLVARFEDIDGMHDLRTRMSGMTMHISFDVEINPNMKLQTAHDIVLHIDAALIKQYPNAEILIHMDPTGDVHDSRHHEKSHE